MHVRGRVSGVSVVECSWSGVAKGGRTAVTVRWGAAECTAVPRPRAAHTHLAAGLGAHHHGGPAATATSKKGTFQHKSAASHSNIGCHPPCCCCKRPTGNRCQLLLCCFRGSHAGLNWRARWLENLQGINHLEGRAAGQAHTASGACSRSISSGAGQPSKTHLRGLQSSRLRCSCKV
jgi:hypothetical protein